MEQMLHLLLHRLLDHNPVLLLPGEPCYLQQLLQLKGRYYQLYTLQFRKQQLTEGESHG